jgi:hypothetical protein
MGRRRRAIAKRMVAGLEGFRVAWLRVAWLRVEVVAGFELRVAGFELRVSGCVVAG